MVQGAGSKVRVQVRPPDLDAAVAVLEAHGHQVELAPVLAR